MLYRYHRYSCLKLILFFVLLRVVLNLLALSHYGFQRDEMLHLALADHLQWGFKEVPPFIAFIAKTQLQLFGSSVFASRIFTTICSGLIVLFTGLLTIEFGGRRFAITVACLALTFSPAFLASGYLLQPVVFDQLWWLLSAYLLVKYFNTSRAKYLYILGVVIGLGMLTKYTMAFFTLALIVGVLLTRQRKIFSKKPIWIAVGIAILIFLPNIIWQLTHHLPLITHMKELRSSQLEYVKPSDFLTQQLLVNGGGLWVWLVGICFLVFTRRLQKFRFLAYAYLFTLLLLVLLNGKIYYLFGAYPMLFAAGGFTFEYWLNARWKVARVVAVAFFILPDFVFLPLTLPVVPINQALPLFSFIDHTLKIDFPFKWEDHKKHLTTQDYGDMFGWDELGLKVAQTYQNLTPEEQNQTVIYADNYGEAGAIHYYGKLYNLPDVICLNSSFSLWAPDSIKAKYIIFVDETGGGNAAKLLQLKLIGDYKKTGEITNPLAREKGVSIYLLTNMQPGFNQDYQKELEQTRLE
jgi:hypothetical protein